MPRSRRRSGFSAVHTAGTIIAAVLLCAGCASRQTAAGPALTPVEVYRSLLGRNPGLSSMRAVAEAHFSFAGREVSLPGVLQIERFGGFRLELLDPLDRPLAILFSDEGRIVHYRPGPALAASLGVFPEGCRGVDPADWVAAILASSVAPVAGETLADGSLWIGGRVLEIHRGNRLHRSIRYENEAGRSVPRQISWYCDDDPVLQVRISEWVQGPTWWLPSHFDLRFPKVGLAIDLELREIEGNPPASSQPLRPQLGTDVRWTSWNIPQ